MDASKENFDRGDVARRQKLHYAMVLVIFAAVCLITSFIFNRNRGDSLQFTVPIEDVSVFKPLDVPKDNTVYLITVRQNAESLPWNSGWNAVTTQVLDENKEYLFGFGGEFWRAKGYDGGYWTEQKSKYAMKLTMPKKGRYFLNFEVEGSGPNVRRTPIYVTIHSKVGSGLPFLIIGIVSLIISVFMGYKANADRIKASFSSREDAY